MLLPKHTVIDRQDMGLLTKKELLNSSHTIHKGGKECQHTHSNFFLE